MKNIGYKFAAVVTTGAMMSMTSEAFAQGFADVTDKITQSSSKLPNLISTVAYIGGIGLGVAGIFKLKQHVDNPAQAPMKDGLIRLGAGGGLLALPAITQAMTQTIGEGASGPNLSDVTFGQIQF